VGQGIHRGWASHWEAKKPYENQFASKVVLLGDFGVR
jgi:hypothetical protein